MQIPGRDVRTLLFTKFPERFYIYSTFYRLGKRRSSSGLKERGDDKTPASSSQVMKGEFYLLPKQMLTNYLVL